MGVINTQRANHTNESIYTRYFSRRIFNFLVYESVKLWTTKTTSTENTIIIQFVYDDTTASLTVVCAVELAELDMPVISFDCFPSFIIIIILRSFQSFHNFLLSPLVSCIPFGLHHVLSLVVCLGAQGDWSLQEHHPRLGLHQEPPA